MTKKRKYSRSVSGNRRRKVARKAALSRAIKKVVNCSQKMNARANYVDRFNNAIGVAAMYSMGVWSRSNISTLLAATCPKIDGATLTYADMTSGNFDARMVMKRNMNMLEIVNTQQYPQHMIALFYQCTNNTDNAASTQVKNNLDELAIDSAEAAITTAELNPLYPINEREVRKCEDWAMLKAVRCVLKPGQRKVLVGYGRTSKFSKGVSIDEEVVDTTNTYLKGISTEWVIQVRGTPIFDTNSRDSITYSESESSCIQTAMLDYVVSLSDKEPRKKALFSTNLSTVLAADQATVDIDIQKIAGAIPTIS